MVVAAAVAFAPSTRGPRNLARLRALPSLSLRRDRPTLTGRIAGDRARRSPHRGECRAPGTRPGRAARLARRGPHALGGVRRGAGDGLPRYGPRPEQVVHARRRDRPAPTRCLLLIADVATSAATAISVAPRSPISARASTPHAGSFAAAIARVHAALSEYRTELDALGAWDARSQSATSAVRDVANGAEFLRAVIERSSALETRPPHRRGGAALTRLGVGADDSSTPHPRCRRRFHRADRRALPDELSSAGLGALTARYIHDDPPPAAQSSRSRPPSSTPCLPALEVQSNASPSAARSRSSSSSPASSRSAPIERAAGVAAALPLAAAPPRSRAESDRAPVIDGRPDRRQVLRRYGLDRLAYSERDLLDGLAARRR